MKKDQAELLESYEEYESKTSFISIGDLVLGLLLVTIALFVFLPKIYLANEIYYTSRDINKLLDQYEILKEENRLLKQRLEQEKFKNQVLDTIF